MDEQTQDNWRKQLAHKAEAIQKLSTVTVVDGISKDEALIIAENLAARFIYCGGFDSLSEEPDRWVIHYATGYTGGRRIDATVMKSNGATTSELINGKTISPYLIWD